MNSLQLQVQQQLYYWTTNVVSMLSIFEQPGGPQIVSARRACRLLIIFMLCAEQQAPTLVRPICNPCDPDCYQSKSLRPSSKTWCSAYPYPKATSIIDAYIADQWAYHLRIRIDGHNSILSLF